MSRRAMIVDVNGDVIYFDYVVELMDDELRELIHRQIAPCTPQEFYDNYVDAHFEKFGEVFCGV